MPSDGTRLYVSQLDYSSNRWPEDASGFLGARIGVVAPKVSSGIGVENQMRADGIHQENNFRAWIKKDEIHCVSNLEDGHTFDLEWDDFDPDAALEKKNFMIDNLMYVGMQKASIHHTFGPGSEGAKKIQAMEDEIQARQKAERRSCVVSQRPALRKSSGWPGSRTSPQPEQVSTLSN